MDNGQQKTFNLGFNATPSNGSMSRNLLANPAPAGWGFLGERIYICPHDLRSTDISFLIVAIGDGEFNIERASVQSALIVQTSDYDPAFLAVTTYMSRVNEVVFQAVPAQFEHLFLGSIGFLMATDGNASFNASLGFIVVEGRYMKLSKGELVVQATKRKNEPSPDIGSHDNIWKV